MQCNDGDSPRVHDELADRGSAVLESIGEAFLRERFVSNSASPDRTFDVARLERFTRADFPRVLLDPQRIDEPLSVDRIQTALRHLVDIVEDDPDGFATLFSRLDDPASFRKRARKLGLTQQDFLKRDGDALWPLVVIVAALVMNGSAEPSVRQGGGPTRCFDQMPDHSAVFCLKPLGHGGSHRNGNWTPARVW